MWNIQTLPSDDLSIENALMVGLSDPVALETT